MHPEVKNGVPAWIIPLNLEGITILLILWSSESYYCSNVNLMLVSCIQMKYPVETYEVGKLVFCGQILSFLLENIENLVTN